jgi:hypothetical protein
MLRNVVMRFRTISCYMRVGRVATVYPELVFASRHHLQVRAFSPRQLFEIYYNVAKIHEELLTVEIRSERYTVWWFSIKYFIRKASWSHNSGICKKIYPPAGWCNSCRACGRCLRLIMAEATGAEEESSDSWKNIIFVPMRGFSTIFYNRFKMFSNSGCDFCLHLSITKTFVFFIIKLLISNNELHIVKMS